MSVSDSGPPEHKWEKENYTKFIGSLKCSVCGCRWYPDQFQPKRPCKPPHLKVVK